jgi:hypothetical protein
VLHYLGPVCALHTLVPEAGGNDIVEQSENGINGGFQMLLSCLILLGPYVTTAMVGQYFLQYLLGKRSVL